jgi:hypothetical protein
MADKSQTTSSALKVQTIPVPPPSKRPKPKNVPILDMNAPVQIRLKPKNWDKRDVQFY